MCLDSPDLEGEKRMFCEKALILQARQEGAEIPGHWWIMKGEGGIQEDSLVRFPARGREGAYLQQVQLQHRAGLLQAHGP